MFLDVLLKGFLCLFGLIILHLLALELKEFSLFVSLGESELPRFILELHEFTRMCRFLAGFSPEAFMELLDLELMLFLELFET